MGFVKLIIIIMIIYFGYKFVANYFGKKIENMPMSDKVKRLEGRDIHSVGYRGGFDDVSMVNLKTTQIVFNDEELEFAFRHDTIYDISETRYIEYKNIKNVKYMNEKTIKERMQLGHMMVFGVLSLGMKAKEEVHTEYIVIDCVNGELENSIILYVEPNRSRDFFNKIKNKMV